MCHWCHFRAVQDHQLLHPQVLCCHVRQELEGPVSPTVVCAPSTLVGLSVDCGIDRRRRDCRTLCLPGLDSTAMLTEDVFHCHRIALGSFETSGSEQALHYHATTERVVKWG